METVRSLCIVVPCFDEEPVIAHTYAALCQVVAALPELRVQFCLVDDGSRDGTLNVLRALAANDSRVRVVALSRNFGHQAAITAGLDHADRRVEAVLVMDADLETPPDLLPRMLDALAQGHDVVLGVRAQERAVGVLRRLGSRWFYAAFNLLSDVAIQPGAPDFYLLSARAREALARLPERSRFLRGMVAWLGFERAYVPYAPGERPHGRSKYTLRRMLRLASDALFAFSTAPVKLTFLGGLASSVLGAALLGYAAVTVSASLALVSGLIALLGGLQLIAISAVGGYVVRNLEEGRGRPLYLVSQLIDARESDGRLVELRAAHGAARRAERSELSGEARVERARDRRRAVEHRAIGAAREVQPVLGAQDQRLRSAAELKGDQRPERKGDADARHARDERVGDVLARRDVDVGHEPGACLHARTAREAHEGDVVEQRQYIAAPLAIAMRMPSWRASRRVSSRRLALASMRRPPTGKLCS